MYSEDTNIRIYSLSFKPGQRERYYACLRARNDTRLDQSIPIGVKLVAGVIQNLTDMPYLAIPRASDGLDDLPVIIILFFLLCFTVCLLF